MRDKIKKTIIAVCHDAGGAEVVSAFVKKNISKYNFVCLAIGPAEKIFKRKKLNKFLVSRTKNPEELFDKFKKIHLILVSTNWSSSISHNFIRGGKSRGIKTAVYLDHWVNYRERFGYPRTGWKKNLPEEIWAGDKRAYKLAKEFFKGLTIKLVPNYYFEEIKKEYKRIKKNKKEKNGILYISEPISEQINVFGDKNKIRYNEFEILEKLFDFFTKEKVKRKIIVRLHPSEKKDKYDTIILKYKNKLKIIKSYNRNVFSDLTECSTVIGIKSMAMVVAYLCGKKVISFSPYYNKSFSLPFKEIDEIKNIKYFKKIIN